MWQRVLNSGDSRQIKIGTEQAPKSQTVTINVGFKPDVIHTAVEVDNSYPIMSFYDVNQNNDLVLSMRKGVSSVVLEKHALGDRYGIYQITDTGFTYKNDGNSIKTVYYVAYKND